MDLSANGSGFDICIVGGAGHVGLPLSLVFANRGQRVLILDINERALELIRSGRMPFLEQGGEALLQEVLRSGNLRLTSDPSSLIHSSTIVVTVGTPIDEFLNPTLRMIKQCFDDLSPYLSDDHLIVLRSTVYPGVTDWIDGYLRSIGKNPMLAFCPERVVQGHALEEVQKFPQIVSGTTKEAEDAAARLFETIAPEIVRLSPKEAEFAKLFTNAYRYIQFAAANEFYMIASSAGVDYARILDGMKKDYPRARDIPRAGFAAGPCLLKDTMQLAAAANNQFPLGHAAMIVNEGLVLRLVDDIARKFPLQSMRVGLLGMAFKADNDDTRSSLSYKLKKALGFRAKAVYTTDPHVTVDPEILPLETVIEKSDLLVLCVPHTAYSEIDTRGKPTIDVCGFLPPTASPFTPPGLEPSLIEMSFPSPFTSDDSDVTVHSPAPWDERLPVASLLSVHGASGVMDGDME